MSERRRLLPALAALAAVAVFSAEEEEKVPRRSVYPASYPVGEGRELAERWCQMCHSATLVTQQAKDSVGWEKTLAQMEKWGVALEPAERDTLRRYLIASFAPKNPR